MILPCLISPSLAKRLPRPSTLLLRSGKWLGLGSLAGSAASALDGCSIFLSFADFSFSAFSLFLRSLN